MINPRLHVFNARTLVAPYPYYVRVFASHEDNGHEYVVRLHADSLDAANTIFRALANANVTATVERSER